jgi:hypothetical protein
MVSVDLDIIFEFAVQLGASGFSVRESSRSFTGSVAEIWIEESVSAVASQFAALVGREIVSRHIGAFWVLSVPVSF